MKYKQLNPKKKNIKYWEQSPLKNTSSKTH